MNNLGKKALVSVLILSALVAARVAFIEYKKHKALEAESLFFQGSGAGAPAVVLLHGLLGSHRYWTRVIPKLSPQHRVIALDLLGFGDSPKPKLPYTVENHTSYIHRTLDGALVQRESFIVVGHSMGAILALNYAIQVPHYVQGLVLVNPPVVNAPGDLRRNLEETTSAFMMAMTFDEFWGRLVCHLHELVPWVFLPIARILAPNLPAPVAEDAVRHTWESYSGSLDHVLINQRIEDLISKVRDIPILIIGSTQDVHATRKELHRLQSQPNVELNIVEGRHNFVVQDPQVLVREVKDFTKKLGEPDDAQNASLADALSRAH